MNIDQLKKGDLVVVLVRGALVAVRVVDVDYNVVRYKLAQTISAERFTVVEPDGTVHYTTRDFIVQTTNNYTVEKLETLYLPKER